MKHDKKRCELLGKDSQGGFYKCKCETRENMKKFDEKLRVAMEKDYYQLLTDSLTPDRGYPFPIDNVKKLLMQYFPDSFI